jgi:hypothetical protein
MFSRRALAVVLTLAAALSLSLGVGRISTFASTSASNEELVTANHDSASSPSEPSVGHLRGRPRAMLATDQVARSTRAAPLAVLVVGAALAIVARGVGLRLPREPSPPLALCAFALSQRGPPTVV